MRNNCLPVVGVFAAPIALLTLLFAALNMINIGLEEVYNRLRGVTGE